LKKAVIFMIMIIGLLFTAQARAADFYFFGVKGEWIKKADWKQIVLGAVVSPLIHEAGHWITLEIVEADYHWSWKGTELQCNFISDSVSKGEARWIARSGFVAQHGVNLLLQTLPKTKETDFTRGYTAMCAVSTWTYPLRFPHRGDFHCITKNGGDGDLEYALFSMLGIHEILRIEW